MQVKIWSMLGLAGLFALAIVVSPHVSRSQTPLPTIPSESSPRENVPRSPNSARPTVLFDAYPQVAPAADPKATADLVFTQSLPAVAAQQQVDPRKEALERLKQLRSQLKAADAEGRGQIAGQIKEALSQYFDLDMQRRRAELDRLGGRVQQTESQLAKRQAARNDLVDLQLRSFMFDAQGLDLLDGQAEKAGRLQNPLVAARINTAGAFFAQHAQYELVPSTEPPANVLKKEMERINAARQKLHAADNADDERVALEELKAALGEYFDSDMEFRRQDLVEIQKQLKRMEARLKQRSNAKDAIVELHLQLILNEADGLGFFRGSSTTSSSYRLVKPVNR